MLMEDALLSNYLILSESYVNFWQSGVPVSDMKDNKVSKISDKSDTQTVTDFVCWLIPTSKWFWALTAC